MVTEEALLYRVYPVVSSSFYSVQTGLASGSLPAPGGPTPGRSAAGVDDLWHPPFLRRHRLDDRFQVFHAFFVKLQPLQLFGFQPR